MAADVEYSADGSLFAAIAPIPASAAPGNVALWRTGARDATAPVLLDLEALGTDPAGRSDSEPAVRHGEVLAGRLAAVRERVRSDVRLRHGDRREGLADRRGRHPGGQPRWAPGRDSGRRAGGPDRRHPAGGRSPRSSRCPRSRMPPTSARTGTRLAIADGTRVVVSDVETGATTETLHVDDGDVSAVEFRPSGELVTAAAAGADHHVGRRRLVGGLPDDERPFDRLAPLQEDERTVSCRSRSTAEPRWWSRSRRRGKPGHARSPAACSPGRSGSSCSGTGPTLRHAADDQGDARQEGSPPQGSCGGRSALRQRVLT